MVWDSSGDQIFRENLKPGRLIDDGQLPRIMRASGVPRRYIGCRLDKIPDSGAAYRKVLESFVEDIVSHDNSGDGLALVGPFGSGKTGASAALIYEVSRRWGRCRFVSARDIGRIANDYDRGKQKQWAELRRYQFVVIDEVGCEVNNDDKRAGSQIKQSTEDLIRHRYDAGLMTVIVSNMTATALSDAYVYLASIFRDSFLFVPVTGVDWRDRN